MTSFNMADEIMRNLEALGVLTLNFSSDANPWNPFYQHELTYYQYG